MIIPIIIVLTYCVIRISVARVQAYKIPAAERQELLREVETLFYSCRSGEELQRLLRGLLSPDERVMLGRRLRIVKLLLEGKTHAVIASELGVGFDTIDRVRRWLERERAAYHLLVERARRHSAWRRRTQARREAPPFSWRQFRRTHPLQFWPLDLVEEVGELVASYRRRHAAPRKIAPE